MPRRSAGHRGNAGASYLGSLIYRVPVYLFTALVHVRVLAQGHYPGVGCARWSNILHRLGAPP